MGIAWDRANKGLGKVVGAGYTQSKASYQDIGKANCQSRHLEAGARCSSRYSKFFIDEPDLEHIGIFSQGR